ncbi:uncharacterized protein LOC142340000 [Convolutriloba macropyga]|uniref:uncharacterized protein LOC142340000 n=1 Tax=Convolutriloba macropyga TaxID=536237 RepID=UPI003F520CE4
MQQQQAQVTREKQLPPIPTEMTSPTLNDIHRRRCHTVNNNLRDPDEGNRTRLFPKMSPSTLLSLNLTPTRTRARKSLRINMFKRDQQRMSMSSSLKSEKPSRRTRSLDPSSPLVNQQCLNNQSTLNQSQTSSILTSSHNSGGYHQKSSSLVGSAKQQITRKASNAQHINNNNSDQSVIWSTSDADDRSNASIGLTSAYQHQCRSMQRGHCKDPALDNYSNAVRNAFLSASLDRAKFTNLKQNLSENRLRRISRSLSNLQQELDHEIEEAKQQAQMEQASLNSRIYYSSKSQQLHKEENLGHKNNLLHELEVGEKLMSSKDCCCSCNCHTPAMRRRTTSDNSQQGRKRRHKSAISPASSYSNSTKLKDYDQTSATESPPRFSSEEDFLDDCGSDDLAEKEMAVKQFLEKITSELASSAILKQKSAEFLY